MLPWARALAPVQLWAKVWALPLAQADSVLPSVALPGSVMLLVALIDSGDLCGTGRLCCM